MPRLLPAMRWPMSAVGLQPSHSPFCIITAPSGRRRGTARISAIAMSAVSSARTPGVFETMMPRWRAVATSMWSKPAP